MATPNSNKAHQQYWFRRAFIVDCARDHIHAVVCPSGVHVVRLAADCVMVGTALALAFLLRFVWLTGFGHIDEPAERMLYNKASTFIHSLPLLYILILPIFVVSGFYSCSRIYRSRYKAIVVAQAVTVAYLLFAAFVFMVPSVAIVPRSVLVLGGACTIALLVLSRFWAQLWRRIIEVEAGQAPSITAVNRPRSVLLIGGAGYIGSALLPKLLASGARVKVFDLLLYGGEPIHAWVEHPNVELVNADFRQVDALVGVMRGVDRVIHLGGIVGDPACDIDEELTIDVNLAATRTIAEIAKGHGVRRFLFASTCSVYGASDEILDEDSCLNPVSLYARSKIASERVLLGMGEAGFAPVIVRFGTIYGLSGRTRFDLVVNLLSAKAALDGEITVYGGDQWRPFVHVDDAAQAVARLMANELVVNEALVVNVGSNAQNHTIGDVGRLVHAKVPEARLIDHGRDGDRRNYRVRFDKLETLTGFRPQWTLEDGIEQVLTAIREGRITDYRDSRYSNAKCLTAEDGVRLVRRSPLWAHELIQVEQQQQAVALSARPPGDAVPNQAA